MMATMIFGYARTSTVDQIAGFEAQVRDLEKAGAERVYREQVSSVAERPELERLLGILRSGDGGAGQENGPPSALNA